MSKALVSDDSWELIEPLIPARPRRLRSPGRQPVSVRARLTGILFALKTGVPWEDLPQEMGCGCGMTCWRRLRDWQRAGVWRKLHGLLLRHLCRADRIDWSRASVEGASVRAVRGGAKTGPNPTDRGKPGSEQHLIIDTQGVPLATTLAGPNAHDVTQLVPLADAIRPVPGKPGRPVQRPLCVQGDRAYGSKDHRRALRRRGIQLIAARPRDAHGSGLGKTRWPVEPTLAWLHQFRRRRLRVRYD